MREEKARSESVEKKEWVDPTLISIDMSEDTDFMGGPVSEGQGRSDS